MRRLDRGIKVPGAQTLGEKTKQKTKNNKNNNNNNNNNSNKIWPTINVDEEETGAEEAEVSSTRGNTGARSRMHATLKTYEVRLA